MIRAVYNGVEYAAARQINEEEVCLVSKDCKTLEIGFEEKRICEFVVYNKIVLRKELESFFERKVYAEYKGYPFVVLDENEKGEILIVNNFENLPICEKLGMKRIDKYVYEMWIPKKEAVITEKIREL